MMRVRREHIVDLLAKYFDEAGIKHGGSLVSKNDLWKEWKAICNMVRDVLQHDNEINIRGVGILSRKFVKGHRGRNPQTGKPADVSDFYKVKIKMSGVFNR
jgi:nucleoid DNA-binding protein